MVAAVGWSWLLWWGGGWLLWWGGVGCCGVVGLVAVVGVSSYG